MISVCFFFFSSRRRHTRCLSDWSSDVCSSDLFEGDEGRGLVQVTRLIGLGRLQNAAVRVAYFHPIPCDRTDRHDRIVSDRFREMLRIEEAMREAVTGVLDRKSVV